MDRESMLKMEALEDKKKKLYEELVDLELKELQRENILGTKCKALIEITNKINSVNKMISETAHGKIEKVQNNSSFEK